MKKHIIILFVLIFSAPIFAEKLDVKGSVSEEFQQIQQKSESLRFDKQFVNLMVAKKGAGKEVVAQKLMKKFKKGSTINMEPDNDTEIVLKENFISIVGNGWDLAVSNDGSKVNFRNWKYPQDHKSQFGKEKEMSLKELETYGKNFIENELQDFIHLGDKEELVFIQSKYEIDGIEAVDGSFVDETVAGNIAYFGRQKEGLMFIGYGSLIIVEFSNDRKPISFYYNWIDFDELDEVIQIASKDEIDYRISALSETNYAPQIKNLEVKTVCGLYYNDTYLQPACEIQQSAEFEVGTFVGVINYIPAGKTYFLEDSWSELKKLNNSGEICQSTDVTGIIFPEDEKQ